MMCIQRHIGSLLVSHDDHSCCSHDTLLHLLGVGLVLPLLLRVLGVGRIVQVVTDGQSDITVHLLLVDIFGMDDLFDIVVGVSDTP